MQLLHKADYDDTSLLSLLHDSRGNITIPIPIWLYIKRSKNDKLKTNLIPSQTLKLRPKFVGVFSTVAKAFSKVHNTPKTNY